MGLDWNPLSRPKPGLEDEFWQLISNKLNELEPAARASVIRRFDEISEAPFETLGAPQVGVDAEADEWLAKRIAEHGGGQSFELALARMHGFYVLDLVPASPGLPVYTSAGYDGVDRYTFRGSFLNDVRDLLGDELFEAAWKRMKPDELRAYGERLLAIARSFAAQHGLEYLEEQRDSPEADEQSPESRAHILFSAAKWCLWWAERGHGLEPYY